MNQDKEEEIKRIKRGLSWVEIKNALQAEGCFICTIVKKSVIKYFGNILHEYALDADVHRKVISSSGLCNTHTQIIMELKKKRSDGLSIASLFETSLHKEIRILGEVEDIKYKKRTNDIAGIKSKNDLRNYKNQINEILIPTGKCAGCEQEEFTESFYTHESLRLWKDREFGKLYESQKIMLCRSHFINMISEAENIEVISYFIGVQKNKLDKLNFLLSEFIRKHDYRYQKEMTDEDVGSWSALLEYLGSKKDVRRKDYINN